MTKLLFDHDKTVSEWCGKKLGCTFYNLVCAIGTMDKDGVLNGAAVLHDHTAHDMELSAYCEGSFSYDLCRAIAYVAFIHKKVQRITIVVPREKKNLLRRVKKFGWVYEGTKRKYYGPFKRHDGIIFGMLANEASRFMRGFGDEQRSNAA